jgi:hypothetical protein
LLLLSLIFYRIEKATWAVPAAVLGSVVMLLGGGKISIVAAVVSVGFFFMLQRKGRTALLVVVSLFLLFVGVLLLAPTGKYFVRYAGSGQAATLTGRVIYGRQSGPTSKADSPWATAISHLDLSPRLSKRAVGRSAAYTTSIWMFCITLACPAYSSC